MSGFCGYTTPVLGKAAGSLGFLLQGDPDKSKPLADTEGFYAGGQCCHTPSLFTLHSRNPVARSTNDSPITGLSLLGGYLFRMDLTNPCYCYSRIALF